MADPITPQSAAAHKMSLVTFIIGLLTVVVGAVIGFITQNEQSLDAAGFGKTVSEILMIGGFSLKGLALIGSHVNSAAHAPGDGSSTSGGFVQTRLLVFIAVIGIVALGAIGCASPLPKSHVAADVANYRTVDGAWLAFIKAAKKPDGTPVYSASYIAACQANYDARGRELVENAKDSGYAPASVTQVSDLP